MKQIGMYIDDIVTAMNTGQNIKTFCKEIQSRCTEI